MICYVFFKESKIISCKIDNVEYISDNDKEIRGNDNFARYGDSQDYICLENDAINLNIGDNIDITMLEDYRDYFLNKEKWYIDKLNKANEQNKSLQEAVNTQQTVVNSLVDTLLEISMNITI